MMAEVDWSPSCWTCKSLKQELRKRGAAVSGRKADLINRLKRIVILDEENNEPNVDVENARVPDVSF